MMGFFRPKGLHGGLHLSPQQAPFHKEISTQTPSSALALQPVYYLSLRQQDGEEQLPLVSVGDAVLRHTPLSQPVSGKGTILHAPTSGIISAIIPHPDLHPSGLPALTIVLQADGKDRAAPLAPLDSLTSTPAALLTRIQQAGIAGMGGAGFPTARKLSHQSNTLIVNAAECEPYITCDDMQLREAADQVVVGAQIAAKIIDAKEILFGIEDDKPQAIAALEQAIANAQDKRMRLQVVATQYPSGSSRQLIELLTGKRLPSQQHSAELGFVCHNSATLKAIYDAVIHGETLTERYTTITGTAIAKPQVFRVRIGTPITALIQAAGNPSADHTLIHGGPMMGHALNSHEMGIQKTSNCILLLEKKQDNAQESACIRCAKCADACPMLLLPQQLYWYSRADEWGQLEKYRLFDCIECGVCASVCPSHIPLVQYYRHSKASMIALNAEKRAIDKARWRYENRNARLAKEAAERQAKMAARRAKLDAAHAPKAETSIENAPNNAPNDAPISNNQRAAQIANTQHQFDPTSANATAPSDKQDAIAAAKARAQARRNARLAQQNAASHADKENPAKDAPHNAVTTDKAQTTNVPHNASNNPPKDGSTSNNQRAAQIANTQHQFDPTSANATAPSDKQDAIAAAKARAQARRNARLAQQNAAAHAPKAETSIENAANNASNDGLNDAPQSTSANNASSTVS